MRVHYGENQSRKTLLNLCAPGRVVHLDAYAFAANQARLSEDLEMLREGGFRYDLVAYFKEVRAVLRAFGAYDVGVDGNAYGIGEGVKYGFDSHILDRGVEERPHTLDILFLSIIVP